MQLLGEVLKKAAEYLKEKKIPEARLSAEWLLAHQLNMKRLDLYLNFDRPLQEVELVAYRGFIARRAKHEPVSYIIGSQPFYGLNLNVSPHVLIPRPETEELVSHIIKALPQNIPMRGLDLCTGSGAIACAIKANCPHVNMHASDISAEALKLAKLNAQENGLDITYHHADLTQGLESGYDFVVCNPPYIAKSVMDTLDPQVRAYEPVLALCGGEDGLDFYRRLKDELPSILNPKAKLFFEIGYDQGDEVMALFSTAPYYAPVCMKDSNHNNRFVMIEYMASEKVKACLEI